MSILAEKLLADDFVWDALVQQLSGKRRQAATQFININCVMCSARGESPDTRNRLGIKKNPDGFGAHCFNCGFRALWKRGQLLSPPVRDLLYGLGVPDIEVKRLNMRALSYRSVLQASPDAMSLLPELFTPKFEARPLPRGAKSFSALAEGGCTDPDFIDVVSYMFSRGEGLANAWNYHWSPEAGRTAMNRRVIVPFYHEGRIVGSTARSIDETASRYVMDAQPNYLFNVKALSNPHRQFAVLLEGVFDAIAIDGVGLMGARLNPQQIGWIKSFGKKIILVPDRDKRGSALIDTAIANNWSVAFPAMRGGHGLQQWWDNDVKDAAEAARRYGRVYTLLSIIETAVENKIKISQLRKLFF